MTGYKVKYHGPTNYRGSRFTVTNLQTGERKTVSYDYSASNAKIAAVSKAFNVSPGVLFYIGKDSQASYYVEAI